MRTLLPPTEDNINACLDSPGTHYFHVQPHELISVRLLLYRRKGKCKMHTIYSTRQRQLRVTISD